MRRLLNFTKRNFLEMLRDPLIYVFCLGFPLVMIILFNVIAHFTGEMSTFEAPSLMPGMVMFSFSFLMLTESLLVSKDRTSAFILRLYTSPMKTYDYVLGYLIPCFAIGIIQEIVCIFVGYIVSLIVGGAFFSFGAALLLMVEMLPMLFTFLFLGILFGTVLNDKSGPGVTSVIITAAGILGGAWMPLDIMGGFETFCRFLPFYPTVYIGRVITGAYHTVAEPGVAPQVYAFDGTAALGFIPIFLYLAAAIALSLFAFEYKKKSDKK